MLLTKNIVAERSCNEVVIFGCHTSWTLCMTWLSQYRLCPGQGHHWTRKELISTGTTVAMVTTVTSRYFTIEIATLMHQTGHFADTVLNRQQQWIRTKTQRHSQKCRHFTGLQLIMVHVLVIPLSSVVHNWYPEVTGYIQWCKNNITTTTPLNSLTHN